MKFALHGVGSGSTVKPEPLLQVAQKAETLGYESVWIPEHLAVPVTMKTPYPYSADGRFPGGPTVALHDPFVALAFVASATKRIKLGTGVFVLPLRNTLAVAITLLLTGFFLMLNRRKAITQVLALLTTERCCLGGRLEGPQDAV